jgi:hypothetical protein
MASPNLLDTPWSVEKDVKASISLHDWSALDPVIHQNNVGITFHPSPCPSLGKPLNISVVEFTTLVSGDEHCAFLQSCKKKLLNHCKKHHPKIVLGHMLRHQPRLNVT